ncbi:ABC transporter permease [Streptosporangium sp. NPDC051023]|uniref:ABC transporter permease n=1 Tax=Streptosporangium sp. NPDC051023 TaxID=3155410 RepID=UPI00344D2775
MGALRLAIRRLLASMPLLFLTSALTFVLVSLVPGDPARTIAGQHSTAEQYRLIRGQLGLDQPLPAQYWHWLTQVFHGDLGSSLFSGEAVTSILQNRLPVSLSLILASTVVSGLAGVALGLLSARRGGVLMKIVDGLAMLGLAAPPFWLALLVIEVFAVTLRWFPVTGYVPLDEDPGGWARSLILPVISIALGAVAIIAKQTRDSVLDTMSKDFIRVMQANGFSPRSILYRHILRNAALPIVTVLGVLMVSLLGAVVFVETVFAMPGVASLTQQATVQHDIPVIQGAVLYITVFVIVVNFVVDLAYVRLDPRVRTS